MRISLFVPALFVGALFASAPAFADDTVALDAAVDGALALELDSELADDGACQNRRRNRGGGGGVSSGGEFGLGLQLGLPTGLTGYFGLGAGQAVQFSVGFGGGSLLLGRVDYTLHFNLVSADPGSLGLYVGGGVFIGAFPFGFGYFPIGSPFFVSPLLLGLEVPLGARWRFHRLPLDIFLELVPAVSVLPGLGFGINGALGARFYF